MALDTPSDQVFEGLLVALFRLPKPMRSLLIQLLVPTTMGGDLVARFAETLNYIGVFFGDRPKNEERGQTLRFVQQAKESIEPSTEPSLLAQPALARELDPMEPFFEIHRKRVDHRESSARTPFTTQAPLACTLAAVRASPERKWSKGVLVIVPRG